MKRLMVTAAGILAITAGTAYAGEGCNKGGHAAADSSHMPELAAAEATDPKLLAKLQEQEKRAEALELLLETPVVHN